MIGERIRTGNGEQVTKDNRFALCLPSTRIRDYLDLARYADQHDVDGIFTVESRLTGDAITPLAVYASATKRIRVGAAGLPIWIRNPALLAETFATLDLLAPGRVVLGLSAWWDPLASQVGIERSKTVSVMSEMIEALRLLLAREEQVTFDGYHLWLRDVFLDHDGVGGHAVKIYVGAVGPQLLRLATRLADGIVLNAGSSVEETRRQVAVIREEAALIGRPFDEIEIVKLLPIRVTGDKRSVIAEHKPLVARYIAEQPHLAEMSGAGPELLESLRSIMSWPSTAGEAARGADLIPDHLVEQLGCYGTEGEVRRRLNEYVDAGVTTPLIAPDTEPSMRRACELLVEGW